jgi:nucleotide-binding universal stress UspA family protein
MYPSILLPLDGSEFSADALPLAKQLASELGAEVHLVHVIRPAFDVDFKAPQEDMEWKARVREGAGDYLEGVASSLEESGVRTTTAVLEGRTVAAIDQYVKEHGISLVVMTTHGAGGLKRWWLGSVADGLLRAGSADLLLVRPWDDTEDRSTSAPRFEHLLVPLDGSSDAERALGPARELTRAMGARLSYLTVVPRPTELTSIYGMPGVRIEGEGYRMRREEADTYLSGVVAQGGEPPPEGVTIEHSSAAEGIIEGARKVAADLLVLSSHGRGGLERTVIGSVADKVIRGSTLPVLVVRRGDGA